MADESPATIDVHTIIYIENGVEIKQQDIPENAEYELQKIDKNGELQYIETRAMGSTQRIGSIAHDGDFQAKADAVLAHAIESGAEVSDYLGDIEIGIVIPLEHFELSVDIEEGEHYDVKAILTTASEKNSSEVKPELLGFIVEVHLSDPVLMRTKKIQYTPKHELYSIDYVMFAVDSDNQISEQYTFCEYGDIAKAEIDEMAKEDGEDEATRNTIFPICDQAYLDEVSQYLGMTFVAHGDFENNQLNDEELKQHENFKRQWFNAEQKPSVMQLFLEHGIGHTEILDVPQEKHMHTVHAYLRLMHKHRQRFSMDEVRATHYIVMLEPLSKVSTDAVPLEDGQYKRHQSICTREGVTVVCECVVFDKDDKPIKKMSFGLPNEVGLMYEEIFKFDENGEPLESEMVQHT